MNSIYSHISAEDYSISDKVNLMEMQLVRIIQSTTVCLPILLYTVIPRIVLAGYK
jgi:hypothetical protein